MKQGKTQEVIMILIQRRVHSESTHVEKAQSVSVIARIKNRIVYNRRTIVGIGRVRRC